MNQGDRNPNRGQVVGGSAHGGPWRVLGVGASDDQTSGARLGSGIGRHHAGPDRRALVSSVVFHVVLTAGLIVSGFLYTNQLPEYVTYQVTLYSPPPVVEGPPEPVEIETKIVTPPKPDPTPITEPPTPVQQPRPTPVTEPEPPPTDPEPPAGERPDPESQGGEDIDVDITGAEFPFPDYLQNIIRQLHRYFRWTGNPQLSGTVVFIIQRDGSASGLQVVEKSGDFNFDLRMMEAVERAARAGAFGALPDGWVREVLPVRFQFEPRGGQPRNEPGRR